MGAVIPETVFDEQVVMRYAQLQEEGKVEQVEKRAMRKHNGNVGCNALSKKNGLLISLDLLKN